MLHFDINVYAYSLLREMTISLTLVCSLMKQKSDVLVPILCWDFWLIVTIVLAFEKGQ